MLTGKRFRLERATLALDIVEGQRRAVTIPVGAILKVVCEHTLGDKMIDVLWEGRTLTMFAIDVDVRGTEIIDQGAGA